MSQHASDQPDSHDSSEVHEASLEQVREILFGAQSRDFEERLVRQQAEFEREMSAFSQGMARRMEQLERTLDQRLSELDDAVESVRRDHAAFRDELDRQLDGARERDTQARRQLRDEMMQRVEAVQRDHGALTETVAEESEQLRLELVDRASLSAILSELALRMTSVPCVEEAQPGESMDDLLESRMSSTADGEASADR